MHQQLRRRDPCCAPAACSSCAISCARSSDVPGGELQVQVDVARAPGPAAAQLVEALQLRPRVVGDQLAHDVQLVLRQRLVHQHPRGAGEDPHARVDDRRRHHQRDDGVDLLEPGHLDQHEAEQHRQRGGGVGAQVRGVPLERRRVVRARLPVQVGRDDQVHDRRDRDHGDAEADVLDLAAAGHQPARGLVHDHAGADQDQHALDRGRQVLGLGVPVLVLASAGSSALRRDR